MSRFPRSGVTDLGTEASTADPGAWRSLDRESYNYFVAADGLGAGPYTLRVTDVHGHVVEQAGIPLGDATESAGTAQLPACPEPATATRR